MQELRAGDPEVVGGRYRLLGRLGAGGMGTVYLGRSPGGRLVAVKCVHREIAADADFRRRFAHELAAVRQVGGFHTAQVVDADPDGEPPWLVTAYIPGPSVADAVEAHGPLPESALRVLGAGLAEALEAIHGAGLIHRDLKPSNVLLADDGPRVIDFGIARALDGTAITRTQVVVGTPGYMAPEQIEGGVIGPPCDVFSLALVICHAAGCAPFGQAPAQIMLYRVVHTEPDLGAVPEALRPVIADCLVRDPARRPTPAQLVERFAPPAEGAGPGGAWLPAGLRTGEAAATDGPGAPAADVPPPREPAEHPAYAAPTALDRPTPVPPPTATAYPPPQGVFGPPLPPAPYRAPGPATAPVGRPRRRALRIVLPLALVLVAAGVAVPLLVLKGHDGGPPECFPSGGSGKDDSPHVTSVPKGTPHAPQLVEPVDRTVVEVGQQVTLSWDHAAAQSKVVLSSRGGSSRYSPWLHAGSCTFTATADGLYQWQAISGTKVKGAVGSPWSETRYLYVRKKGATTANPVKDAPDSPRSVAPADQTVVKAGEPVTLEWTRQRGSSYVSVQQPDGTWKFMAWQSGTTYAYTPPSPGVYVWIVNTADSTQCKTADCVSTSSEQRYLIAK